MDGSPILLLIVFIFWYISFNAPGIFLDYKLSAFYYELSNPDNKLPCYANVLCNVLVLSNPLNISAIDTVLPA